MSSQPRSIQDVARDPLWLADRYDPGHDSIHFRYVDRDQHRAATFLTDEYLGTEPSPIVIRREDVCAAAPKQGPIHFIFHSAFCCSTLLARTFDLPGVSMGLREPTILNDIVGWRHRGGDPQKIGPVLDDTLAVLSRPYGSGEAIIVKPSNVCNGIAEAMIAGRPQARAILLYAPLPIFLASVSKKGMWGRLWVRDLMIKQLKDGLIDLGFEDDDYLGLTDLQVAAVGWLAQQDLFARIYNRFGSERILRLDSETLLDQPCHNVSAIANLFGLNLSKIQIDEIIHGSAFSTNSKTGLVFNREERDAEYNVAAQIHSEEIEKVTIWAKAVAVNAGLELQKNV